MPVNSEIRKYIRTGLQEASANRWTDLELVQAWDEAQKDFSIRTEILETQASMATVSGTSTYGYSNFVRFLKVKKIIYDFGSANAHPLDYFDYQDYPWPQKSQSNIPQWYTTYDDKFELLFKPNAAVTLQVLYAFSCSDIRNDIAMSANGESSQLPERYHLKACERAIGMLLMKYDDTVQRGQVRLGLYEKFVGETIGLNRRPADDTRRFGFKTMPSPGFMGDSGDMGSGYTGRPLWTQ